MGISAIMGIAVSGMQAQTTRLSAAANNVANALTPGYDRAVTTFSSRSLRGVSASASPSGEPTLPGGSNVDLANELVDAVGAELAFKANASVFETGADLWDVLMNIKRD